MGRSGGSGPAWRISACGFDAPSGMDLVPVVVSVEHPWPDDSYVCSKSRSRYVTSRACTETGDIPEMDPLAAVAAGLVTRDDLDVQAALAAVVGVQHAHVAGIR